MNSIIFIFGGIVFLIVIILAYYYIHLPTQSNTYKYKIPVLESETLFDEDFNKSIMMTDLITTRPTLSIPEMGYGITFQWEMYIPNLSGNATWHNSFNIVKPLFYINDSPQIGYNPKKNYLSIIMKYRDNPFYAQFSEIKIPDLKLQKWCSYILVIAGRNIQLWIDGIINTTDNLPSLPVVYDIESTLTLGQKNNNFLGKIRNLYMYPYPLSYSEITSIM